MKTIAFSFWHVGLFAVSAVGAILWAARAYRRGAGETPAEQARRRREGRYLLVASLALLVSGAGALVGLADRRVEAAVATACAGTAAAAFALGLRWLGGMRGSAGEGRVAVNLPPVGRVAVAALLILIADGALILAILSEPTTQTVGLALFGVAALFVAAVYLGQPKR